MVGSTGAGRACRRHNPQSWESLGVGPPQQMQIHPHLLPVGAASQRSHEVPHLSDYPKTHATDLISKTQHITNTPVKYRATTTILT